MRSTVPVLILIAGGILGESVHAEVKVQLSGDQVTLRAVSAPLSEVLDRLAHQTGMKVLYEGAPPRQPVTVALERRTSAELVFSLLEGLGLDYALRLDESGGQVMTLVMSGHARPATPVVAQASPVRPPMPDEGEEGVPMMPGAFQQAPDEAPIPPPDPNPPPPPAEQNVAPQANQFVGPSLGAGFSSPYSNSSFSGPSVFAAPAPAAQPVPAPAPKGEEPQPDYEPPIENQ